MPADCHCFDELTAETPAVETPAVETPAVEAPDEEAREETCDRCDETFSVYSGEDSALSDVTLHTGRIVNWCASCVSDHATTCVRPRCYERIEVHEQLEVGYDGEYACPDCIQEHYTRCHDCGCLARDNSVFYCDHCDVHYCQGCEPLHESCGDPEDDSSRLIHDYGYKPYPRFYGRQDQIHYGVELEVNADEDTAGETLDLLNPRSDESHAYLKYDSSIGTGYEIVTHPHTLDSHRELWQDFFGDLPRGMTSYKSGACGMHVHIERKKLSALTIAKLSAFVNATGNQPFIACIAQRTSEQYASIVAGKKLVDFRGTHFDAVNTANSQTIEVRIFRGTVRKDRFFKNLEFIDGVIRWLRCMPAAIAIQCGSGWQIASTDHLDYRQFIGWIRSHRKDYPYLFAYLVEKGYTVAPKRAPKVQTPASENIATCEASTRLEVNRCA